MSPPRLVIGGSATGTGKTTVVCALACALMERGVDVRLFKAGPDYLDPSFHQAATGRASRNLDGWMMGPDSVTAALARGCAGGRHPQIALIEGMMGLFDGRSPTSLAGSTAELAELLKTPVLLVLDASGAARTAAAVVEGLAGHSDRIQVGGVIFNKVGSPGHTELLTQAVAHSKAPLAVLGGLPARADLFLPSRHLGLVSARECDATRSEAARRRWRHDLAKWAQDHVDLDGLMALAAQAPSLDRCALPTPLPPRARLGIARDDAFSFYYPDNLDLLTEAGAELVPFSPLVDRHLPGDLDGLLIGGGYPELHAAELSANRELRAEIRALAQRGAPVLGECGGLMYLGEALVDLQGHRWPMVGALPLITQADGQPRVLGYRDVQTTEDTLLGPAGTTLRGHEFHVSGVTQSGGLEPVLRWTGWGGEGTGGVARAGVLATYIHGHWGSNPRIAHNLVDALVASRSRTEAST